VVAAPAGSGPRAPVVLPAPAVRVPAYSGA
jgi:hypothetical protein